MYLQKLEIQGFKSFAKKTTLEFNRELTAIVGPNGSGKSNIADAIRWVLGEQSLKLLRGKKSQDVIFAGSDKKARLGFAEVNLYLNNEDGRAPIDYREIVITRRIYRDGESEYLINKNTVRLQDIQMLIAKANFGQKSYSLVGQGMIDSILTSSPQERKEFFDEATGVRKYQIKRERSLNKLERAYENLQQSQQLIKEIKPRLRSLTRQMKRLEQREEVKSELTKLQDKYYSHLDQKLNRKLKQQQQSYQQVDKEKQQLEDKLSQLQQKLEKIETDDTQSQAFRQIELKYSQLVNEKNKLLQEISLLQGKIDLKLTSEGKQNLVWLRKKSEELALEMTALKEELAQTRQQTEEHQSKLDNKLSQQKEVLQEFQAIRQKLLGAQSGDDNTDLKKIFDQFEELNQSYTQFVHQLDRADENTDLEPLKEQAYKIKETMQELRSKFDSSPLVDADEIQFLEQKMDQFMTTKDTLVDEINQIKVNLEIAKNKHQQVEERYRQAEQEKQKIDNEIKVSTSESVEQQQDELQKQKKQLNAELQKVEASLEMAQQKIEQFNKQADSKQGDLIDIQKQSREYQIKLNEVNNQINKINVEIAKLETRLEDLHSEIKNELGSNWKASQLEEEIDEEKVSAKINSLKNKLSLIGGIDETVPDEYSEVKERYDFLSEQADDLENSIQDLESIIKELDQKISEQFEKKFKIINQEFQKYFSVLFDGGNAKLIMKTKNDEQADELPEEGEASEEIEEEKEELSPVKKLKQALKDTEIDIKASPPGKKVSLINTLSGGEKALTAIALICAIISANPSPFVFLDEVDAALDEANTARYVAILNELTNKTQFIAITHNRVTMHQAAILYGVTMGDDGVSRILSINLNEAEEKYSDQIE